MTNECVWNCICYVISIDYGVFEILCIDSRFKSTILMSLVADEGRPLTFSSTVYVYHPKDFHSSSHLLPLQFQIEGFKIECFCFSFLFRSLRASQHKIQSCYCRAESAKTVDRSFSGSVRYPVFNLLSSPDPVLSIGLHGAPHAEQL